MTTNQPSAAQKRRMDEVSRFETSLKNVTTVLDEEWKKVEKGRNDLHAKKADMAKQNGGANVSGNDILDINAGGQIVRVSRGTLTQIEGSRLEALFSGRWEKQLQRDANGRIFLDVNPVCFNAIVDYLNEFKLSSPENPPDLPRVSPEDQVFLDSLLIAFGLDTTILLDSDILKDRHDDVAALRGFLEEDSHEQGLELLYRGSRDGMSGAIFHSKCDNQGPTVTVVRSDGGFIFGGFSDISWDSSASYKSSAKAFLFGLNCHGGNTPVKMRIKPDMMTDAIYCDTNLGPTFGAGHDLLIFPYSDNATCDFCEHSYFDNAEYYFTGGSNSIISDIEAFKVVSRNVRLNVSNADAEKEATYDPVLLESLFSGGFPEEMQKRLKEEQMALQEAFDDLAQSQEAFEKEQAAVKAFCAHAGDEIIYLNVSGQSIAVKQSTLATFPESALYKQFADPNWTEKTQGKSPREWDTKKVTEWSNAINGLSEDVSALFDSINGIELLALKREDLKEMGITRPATLALVIQAIDNLREEEEESSATFIEHSSYCFGKIIDTMRLKAMEGLDVPEPSPPEIREPERKRFKRIVEYYFPTSASAFGV